MATVETLNHLQFSVHGIDLKFTTNSSALAESVSDLLRPFECERVEFSGALRMQFDAVRQREDIHVRPSRSSRRLYAGSGLVVGDERRTTWACDIVADGGRLIADFGAEGLIVIDGAMSKAQGYLVQPESMQPDIRASFLHFAMMELLKHHKLYTFHATALEKHGLGVLIPGYSGRGKTTAFLSLLRSGYRYLSDDHPFLRADGGHLEILPFPMKINVTETTIAFFPELRDAQQGAIHQAIPKRYLHAKNVYPGPPGSACEAALILFPNVIDAPQSRLEPLSKHTALKEILPHCLLVFDPEVAKEEFRALTSLVRQADCYRLHFGRDVLTLPALVDPLLEVKRARAGH
jgi:hypothetical protein